MGLAHNKLFGLLHPQKFEFFIVQLHIGIDAVAQFQNEGEL
jgi:hypothetical protein